MVQFASPLLVCYLLGIGAVNGVQIPKWFDFGVGTSAYQIEGAWNEDGKGLSICDTWAHSGATNATGDVACDSYHKLADDVRILKELGVNGYRFSIAWTRIFPFGTTNIVRKKGIAYYDRLINSLMQNGIEPIVTLFHWDTPQTLQDLGGWANEMMIKWYVDYADHMFALFGDRVKTWTTLNEPANYCHYGYNNGLAPNLNSSGVGEYLCAHNMIRAHARTYRMYQRKYKARQKGKIGISLDCSWKEPEDPTRYEDVEAARAGIEFHFGWFAYPIFKTGDYPTSLRQRVDSRSRDQGFDESRLPRFSIGEKIEVYKSADFMGLNHYSSFIDRFDNQRASEIPNSMNDRNIVEYVTPNATQLASEGMTVSPGSIKKLLLWLGDTLGRNLVIYITENGYSGRADEGMDDQPRVDYLNSYLAAVLEARQEGVNIHGYTWWSLMDNFEWTRGYDVKFGLYHVDFGSPKRTRTARKSALVYRHIIKSRRIDPKYQPTNYTRQKV